MIIAGRGDFEIYADAAWPENEWQIETQDGNPLNLTGLTLRLTVRSYDDDPNGAVLTVVSGPTSGNRIQLVDTINGVFRIWVDEATINAFPRSSATTNEATDFRWQLQYTTGGNDFRLGFGYLRVWGLI